MAGLVAEKKFRSRTRNSFVLDVPTDDTGIKLSKYDRWSPNTNSIQLSGDWDYPDVSLEEESSGLDKGVVHPDVRRDDVGPVGRPGRPNANRKCQCQLFFHSLNCLTFWTDYKVSDSHSELFMVHSLKEFTKVPTKFGPPELLEDGVDEAISVARGWWVVCFVRQTPLVDGVDDLLGRDCHLGTWGR